MIAASDVSASSSRFTMRFCTRSAKYSTPDVTLACPVSDAPNTGPASASWPLAVMETLFFKSSARNWSAAMRRSSTGRVSCSSRTTPDTSMPPRSRSLRADSVWIAIESPESVRRPFTAS